MTPAALGGALIIVLAIGGGLAALGIVARTLLSRGVIAAHLIAGRDDRGESHDYTLDQSCALAEEKRNGGTPAEAGSAPVTGDKEA